MKKKEMKKMGVGGILVRYKEILGNKFYNIGKFKLKYIDPEITGDFSIQNVVTLFLRKQINDKKDYFVRWYIYKLYNSSVPPVFVIYPAMANSYLNIPEAGTPDFLAKFVEATDEKIPLYIELVKAFLESDT